MPGRILFLSKWCCWTQPACGTSSLSPHLLDLQQQLLSIQATFSGSEIETLIWMGSGTSCWEKRKVGQKMKFDWHTIDRLVFNSGLSKSNTAHEKGQVLPAKTMPLFTAPLPPKNFNPIITQIPNLFSLGLDLLGDLERERELDLDLELELFDRDLERLRLLDLDDEEDELLLLLRRFLLLGGEPDFDLERLKNR